MGLIPIRLSDLEGFPMKYSDLEKVLAIYEERSFTAAAKRLYLTQPAISQNIALLEKELNVGEPYSILYTYRLQAMVDYNNHNTQNFTNSMVMYNSEYKAWMDNYNRHHKSNFVGIKAI